jgi:hypothetical protein
MLFFDFERSAYAGRLHLGLVCPPDVIQQPLLGVVIHLPNLLYQRRVPLHTAVQLLQNPLICRDRQTLQVEAAVKLQCTLL